MGEFRHRHRFNETLRPGGRNVLCTASPPGFRNVLSETAQKSRSAFSPSDETLGSLLILGEAKNVDKQVTTSGGKLRIKKSNVRNQFALSGASFLPYLKTPLHGYVLCAMAIVFRPVGLKHVRRRATMKCNGLRCVQYSSITIHLGTLSFATATRYGPSFITPHQPWRPGKGPRNRCGFSTSN